MRNNNNQELTALLVGHKWDKNHLLWNMTCAYVGHDSLTQRRRTKFSLSFFSVSGFTRGPANVYWDIHIDMYLDIRMIYVYIYIPIYKGMWTHSHVRTHTHTHAHVYINMNVLTSYLCSKWDSDAPCACVRTFIQVCVYLMHMLRYISLYIYNIYMRVNIYVHIHICIYTCIHTKKERKRERGRERKREKYLCVYTHKHSHLRSKWFEQEESRRRAL